MMRSHTIVRSAAGLFIVLCPTLHAQIPVYSIHGTATNERLGERIVDGSDLNGDGRHEILVGAPGDSVNANIAGGVRVVDGVSGMMLFTIHGTEHGGNMGAGLDDAGDVNGDGVHDLLVGAPGEWIPNLTTGGTVRVYSGADAALLRTIYGGTSAFNFGAVVAGIGDVNGDGRSDFVVGGAFAAGGARIFVYSGATGALLYSIVNPSSPSFGVSAAGLGDVNGDGTSDFCVGSSLDDNANGIAAGSVRICSGSNGATLATILGDAPHALFGAGVRSAGDVDGDGRQDLLTNSAENAFWGAGRVWLYSGATGALIRVFSPSCPGEGFGASAAVVGDWDGDGRADVAVGTLVSDCAQLFSGATGALLGTWRYRAESAPVSGAIAVAGVDVSGDGRRELVIGFSRSDFGFVDAGELNVYADTNTTAVGSPFGFGDGSGAPCPCGNTGTSGAGCANSTGLGGKLRALGASSVSHDALVLQASQLPPGRPALLFFGPQKQNGGLGVPFGDGLLAVGGQIRRIGALSNCIGEPWWGPGLCAQFGWIAGQTQNFQAWYRDPSGPCGKTSNVTNAAGVTFTQ